VNEALAQVDIAQRGGLDLQVIWSTRHESTSLREKNARHVEISLGSLGKPVVLLQLRI
jgi:hypothetical protein